MSNLSIEIGKGESKTIRFKIITTMFKNSDRLLFAIKNDVTSKEYIYTQIWDISQIAPTDNLYTFTLQIPTEFSRSLNLRTYYYDLTLIDEYGEEKPLISPQSFSIIGTIGASLKKEGE